MNVFYNDTCTGLPEVTVAPSNQTVELTHTATFTTTARGVGVDNFMYQWRHNGTIMTGETGDTLVIPNLKESDSGQYDCIVTNQYGDQTLSEVATLIAASEYGIKIIKEPYNNGKLLIEDLK